MTIKTNTAQDNFEQIKLNKAGKLKRKTANYQFKSNLFPSNSNLPNFIYVTDNKPVTDIEKTPLNIGLSEAIEAEIETDISSSFPLFFQNIDTIYIPKKAKRHLEKNVPKAYLKAIDTNISIANEKCLLLLSSLSSTVYSENRWKELSSTKMDALTKKGNDNTRIYSKGIEALKYNTTTTEGIVQVKKNSQGNETYQEGVSCKSYSLTDTYYDAGLVKYKIKNPEILEKRKLLFFKLLKKAQENVIGKNLIALYAKIELPCKNDITFEAKRLVKIKHTNKKGKLLTFLHKHPKSNFIDADSRSFVEDNIKLFEYLTKNNYRIPTIGNPKSGGRVVDSFTLMPSWIRKLVKIDGEPIVEVDYKALHPNIAMSIYGGSKKYLTHDQVADESNIPKNEVKIEHLSFFNKTVSDMKWNKLYPYYKSSESVLLKNIEADKLNNNFDREHKHKITSMRMFAKEVEIMTECIRQLNAIGIYVGYVYDALFCKKSDAEIVKKIMNEVVIDCGVYTTAEINWQ